MNNMSKQLYSYKSQLLTVAELQKLSKVPLRRFRHRLARGMDYRIAMLLPRYSKVVPKGFFDDSAVLVTLDEAAKHDLDLRLSQKIVIEHTRSMLLPMSVKAMRKRFMSFPESRHTYIEYNGWVSSFVIMQDGFIIEALIA